MHEFVAIAWVLFYILPFLPLSLHLWTFKNLHFSLFIADLLFTHSLSRGWWHLFLHVTLWMVDSSQDCSCSHARRDVSTVILVSSGCLLRSWGLQEIALMLRDVDGRVAWAEPELLTRTSPRPGVSLQQLRGENEILPQDSPLFIPTSWSFSPRLVFNHPNLVFEDGGFLVPYHDCKPTVPLVKQAFVLSRIWLFAIPWTVACQSLLFLKFCRQEYRSGLPFPPP